MAEAYLDGLSNENVLREQFSERVKTAEKAVTEDDVTEEDLKDIPVPSEDELKIQASKLTQEEMIANLKLIRDLLQDDEEEVSDQERELLTKAHDKLADIINNANKASIIDLEQLHFCTSSNVELARMCWGHPCGQNIGRRARSLTPKGMKEGYQRRGSSQAAEYTLGKYSFKYRPKNIKEAKRKIKKANTSRARWAAASLILAVPALIPGVSNPAYKKLKQRSDEKRTAKRQYHSLKLSKPSESAAAQTVTAAATPTMTTYLDSLPDEAIATLEQVLGNVVDVRSGKGSDALKLATKTVDRILREAPGLPADVIIYQLYNGISASLRDGAEITENAFLTGTGTKPEEGGSDPVTVAIKLPAGTKALCLPDGGYVLARKQTLLLKPTETGDIPAIIKGWRSLTSSALSDQSPRTTGPRAKAPVSPTMHLYSQWAPVEGVPVSEEFYNKNHGKGGLFTSGKGGGGGLAAKAPGGGSGGFGKGGLAAKSPGTSAQRKAKLKRIGAFVGQAVLAGVAVGILLHTTRPKPGNNVVKNRQRQESPSDWYDRVLREKPVIR